MKNDEKIMTLHPQGKSGVNISFQKYSQLKTFILSRLKEKKEITFKELTSSAYKKLTGKFTGNISWYLVTVKLDLEARKLIERIPNTSPHKLRLIK